MEDAAAEPLRHGVFLTAFADAAEVADQTLKDYGSLQNQECGLLRQGLKGRDPVGTGRIPIKEFSGKRVYEHLFAEPESYLRDLGVLDESEAEQGPQVLIANCPARCRTAWTRRTNNVGG